MLGTILIVILILALLGALPRWSHSRDMGLWPTGGVGLVLFGSGHSSGSRARLSHTPPATVPQGSTAGGFPEH